MTAASQRPGCPPWCQEKGKHETHRLRLSTLIATGGERHESIQLGLMLPPGRRHALVEMMIYQAATEVTRIEVESFNATDIAAELIAAAFTARYSDKLPPQ